MNLGDIGAKIAANKALSAQESEFWRVELNKTQQMNSVTAGFTKEGSTNLNIGFPIEVIYSEVLVSDVASITVQIPAKYRHIQIEGAGRVSTATGGNIWIQFNDDQASNYSWVLLTGNGASATSIQDTSDIFAPIGVFAQSDAAAGESGSFFSKISNISGSLYKTVVGEGMDVQNNDVFLFSGKWANTSPIRKIRISATDGGLTQDSANIVAGAAFSVYGLI